MELELVIKVALIGLLSGVVGTGGGGLIAYVLRHPTSSFLSTILGFSAGVMLVVVFFELLPEAFTVGTFIYGMIGLLLGIIILMLLDIYFPQHHHYSDECRQSRFRKAGNLLGNGIDLHNIPEVLAIGAGYASGEALGLGLAVIMTVQNIPEGVAMATAMCIGGISNGRGGLGTAMAGLPMGLERPVGALIGSISPVFLAFRSALQAVRCFTLPVMNPSLMRIHPGHSATLGIVAGL